MANEREREVRKELLREPQEIKPKHGHCLRCTLYQQYNVPYRYKLKLDIYSLPYYNYINLPAAAIRDFGR